MRKPLLVLMGLLAILFVGFQVIGQYSIAYTVETTVDIKPDTLNVDMQGRWITAFIRLPEGLNVSDIDPSTILLEHLFQVERSDIEAAALMVKFDAYSVRAYLQSQLFHLGVHRTTANLLLTGKLRDGTEFAGTDEINVIFPKDSAN